jgi:hypothetical protein
MYTLSLKVKETQNETINLEVPVIEVAQNYFSALSQLVNSPDGFFLKLPTNSLTSIIDLSSINSYELWYFDDEQNFTGKAFALSNNSGSFLVQTQAKFVLVIHREIHSNLCKSIPASFTFNTNS